MVKITKMHVFNALLVLLIVLAVTGGLGALYYRVFPLGGRYGKDFNSERIKRGLLPIPENWENDDYGALKKIWEPLEEEEGFRSSKVVVLEDGRSIVYEEDYIFFGDVGVQIGYSYSNEALGLNPWKVTFQDEARNHTIISKEQLDSILVKWGVTD